MKTCLIILVSSFTLMSSLFAQPPDVPAALVVDDRGNVIVAGMSMDRSGRTGYVLLAYDSSGNIISENMFPSETSGASIVSSLEMVSDTMIVTGSSPAVATGHDIVTVFWKDIMQSTGGPVTNPAQLTLDQSYPNPLLPGRRATITYGLSRGGIVKLSVVDVTGREVTVLHEGFQTAGRYQQEFQPGILPTGTYFYVLRNSTTREVRKMAVQR